MFVCAHARVWACGDVSVCVSVNECVCVYVKENGEGSLRVVDGEDAVLIFQCIVANESGRLSVECLLQSTTQFLGVAGKPSLCTPYHVWLVSQVKCYLQMSDMMEEAELKEAMEVVESTNLKYFTKDMISKFMALKGSFLANTGKYVATVAIV